MYLNLLSKAMNRDTVMLTHPAYVDIIKSMSPLDAIVFNKASQLKQVASARIRIEFGDRFYTDIMPETYAPDLISEHDPFSVSISLNNLCRLGLLFNRLDSSINGYSYDNLKETAFVKHQFELCQQIDISRTLEIKMEESVLVVTDFGKNFAKVCL